MASVYDTVFAWSNATSYTKYSIVSGSDSRFYYSLIDNNSANNPTTTTNLQSRWDGYILINSVLFPNFFWKPSYQSNSKIEPRVKKIQFGNGYQQRIADGINFQMKNLSLNFDNRTEIEAVSILHFLEKRGGREGFIYNVPTIYAKTGQQATEFIAPSWEVSYNFYNNYSIRTTFEEVPA